MDKNFIRGKNFKFSLERALLLAEMSALAYKRKEEIEEGLRARSVTGAVYFFEKEDTQGFFAGNEKTLLLAFRGTEKSSPQDWLTDFNAKLIDCGSGKVHRGVKLALDRVWKDIEDNLPEFTAKDREFWITGHSLGGALAMLSAFRLMARGIRLSGLYTFGQPRLGNEKFAKRFNRVFRKQTFRLVNEGDIIACVPPRVLGYAHAGRQISLERTGKVHEDQGNAKSFICKTGKNIVRPGAHYRFLVNKFPEGLQAHRIDAYIARMRRNF